MRHLKQYILKNKKLIIFLAILVLIAITTGSILSVTISSNDNELVKNYLTNYLTSINNKELVMTDSFLASLINNTTLVLSIFLLNLSLIGLPIILIIFFYKSFLFGFTIGSILVNYKAKGILLSIIYMFPHNLIDILILMFYFIVSFNLIRKTINNIINKEPINIKRIKRYFIITLQVLIAYILISAYSSYIVPILIRSINILK